MRVHAAAVRLAICIGLFHVASAAAGDLAAVPSMMAPIYMNNTIVSNMMGSARLGLPKQGRPSSSYNYSRSARGPLPSLPEALSDDFHVGHDQGITTEARRTFLMGVVRSSGQRIAHDFDRQIGDVQSTFAQAVAGYGLRSSDFSDVMTAYTVMMWMAANRQVELPRASQINGVRSQLRPTLAGKLGDARQRQLIAETMMYQTCILIAAREQAEHGKPRLLDAAAAAIDSDANGNGNELRRLALTDQGLMRH